jgi:hypothetical protein
VDLLHGAVLKLGTCEAVRRPDADVRREIIGVDHDGAVDMYGWRDGADFWIDLPGIAQFRFRPSSDSVVPFPEPDTDRETILDQYLGTALPMAMHVLLGYEALHASAVVSRSGVVAFCGATEVGKSTVAYGLATRGYAQWGDDAVAFSTATNRRPTSLSLPFRTKLRPASAEYFRGEPVAPQPFDLDAHEWREAPVGAVCVLRPLPSNGAEPVVDVVRLAAAQAIREVLPNAYRFRPEASERRRQTIRSYLELVARVPVFSLTYTKKFAVLPKLLDLVEEAVEREAAREAQRT